VKVTDRIVGVVAHEDGVLERMEPGLSRRSFRLGSSSIVVDRRWAGGLIRAALFIAFVLYLYHVKFAPSREAPFEDAETVVGAVNAGRPFELLYPPHDGMPAALKRMSEVDGDYGVQLLVSVTGSAGRWLFGPSFRLRTQVARVILFGLFATTAAVILAPPVPLAAATAGVLSLFVLMRWGPVNFSAARFWGVAYAAEVGSVYLATALKPWNFPRMVVLLLLASLAAYAQFLRQEAAPTSDALGVALVVASAITWLVVRRSAAPRVKASSVLARRALGGGLLLLLANAAAVPLERWCFAMAWGKPFSETARSGHGVGWPMYLSLGYVSNPYNIGWRDRIGEVHAQLIRPRLYTDDPEFQPTLLREYERVVIDRPWLLVRNVLARARRIHELAGEPSAATMSQPRPLVFAYWAMPWMMLGCLLLLVRRGTAEGAVIWVCALALAAGASAGPLLVFPEYLGGLQGSIVVLILVVPGAIAGSILEAAGAAGGAPLARRILAFHGLAAGAVAGLALTGIGVQAVRDRDLKDATFAMDPVTAITVQEFRYAHVFNDLPLGKQGRIIARLLASRDPSLARKLEPAEGDVNLFRPDAVVRTGSQVHVIAWMGRGFVAPVPRLFQGATHASLLVCGDCPRETSVNDSQTDLHWTMIGDLEWQGRYRMFSLPLTASLRRAASVLVTVERTVRLDFSRPTWLVPELISRVQFAF
jgi:hypothetical protein